MDNIIKFLNKNGKEYDIGIIKDGFFYKLPIAKKEKQVICFKWKKNSINKIVEKLSNSGICLIENFVGNYNALYDIKGTKNKVLITYAVDSHVQLPKVLLKNFRTGDDLFILNTSTNKLFKSSASQYNTAFGYYSAEFEEYLSVNYEKIISDIIKTLKPFINKEVENIALENINEKINKLFLMALIRNPKYIKDINDYSFTSQFFDGGYNAEQLIITGEKLNYNFLEDFTPVPLVNVTNKNLLTIKSLVSNLYIDGNIKCMVVLLHPKVTIALVPNGYYKQMIEEQGKKTYLQLNDEKNLIRMNKQIYNCAKFNNEDVIGIKTDLDDLITYIEEKGEVYEH